ncbi:LysR family transcriptional regulator [Allopusillimonas ginsengisoli]|uniref:LysR family transcriptional regulator n=1 Tax=Allopusillimonas ginsengisoli TaxID=453575 RepID=UPI00101F8B79|nr:LysR family transcriptional regulator [Allopusillimonas ginsengisoli]TEA77208.1 LysR family transcriptional regulator [Allopusillimonas ginsengisoli]
MPEDIQETRLIYLFESIQRGTMRAAADALNVAPSAVSRQIALLERELALPLIERHTRGVKATEAGQLVLSYFREQLAHKRDLLMQLQEMRGLHRGTVRIALGEGFIADLMTGPMHRYASEFPGISVMLDVGGTNEVMRRITEDESDIGLVFNPPPDAKVVSRASSRQPVNAIVGPAFPLLGRSNPIAFAECLKFPVALNHDTYGMRQLLHLVEQTEHVRLQPKLTTNSFYGLRAFVSQGLGITFLPDFVAHTELQTGELVSIPVNHPVLQAAEVHLITRTGRKLSMAANRMMQYMSSGLTCLRAI